MSDDRAKSSPASDEANQAKLPTGEQLNSTPAHKVSEASQGDGQENEQKSATVSEPKQLKSHFRGMPKNWEINRNKQ
ncbi:hypothetical protein JX266_008375 [Neoarthrinium moseri]|nr:hypothetical protein JX266_008375 [Neoarthrinium moseri]